MTYIISSNVEYEKKTLPRLLNSMLASGIESENIHVFVGRALVAKRIRTRQATYHYVEYGAYEHTALIGSLECDLNATNVFLLHDTCEVGMNFPWLVRSGFIYLQDAIAVNWGMCGFGMYRMPYLEKRRDDILALKNCDKHTAMVAEGFLIRSGEPRLAHFPALNGVEYQVQGLHDVYGTGQVRLKEYYPQVDMYKYKANYGQTSPGSYIEVV